MTGLIWKGVLSWGAVSSCKQPRSNRRTNVVITIIVRHKKSDFLRLGLYAALRGPTLRWMVLVVAVVIFAINVYQSKSPWQPFELIATFLTAAVFAFGYFLLMLGLTVLSALLRNRKGSPAADVQTYSLTDLGLSRQSRSSETLLKWGGARSLHRNRSAIYVAISASSYMILPRHSFASDEQYGAMWSELQRLAPSSQSGEGQQRP